MTDYSDDLEGGLERLRVLKDEMKADKAEYDQLVADVLSKVGDAPELILGADGKKYRVTKVTGSTPIYHYEHLGMLTAEQREAIMEHKISGAKLAEAITGEVIPADLASKLVEYKDTTPWPKFDPLA